jgi:hypothetical protein
MAERITIEQWGDRPAWQVRVGGTLAGVVWRQGGSFRAVQEGSSTPNKSSFSSREAAARAVARMAGFHDFDSAVAEVRPR